MINTYIICNKELLFKILSTYVLQALFESSFSSLWQKFSKSIRGSDFNMTKQEKTLLQKQVFWGLQR